MKNSEDLTGKTFGKIEVLSYIGSSKDKRKIYRVKCKDCGKEDIKDATSIKKYGTFKCDCPALEIQNHIDSMIGKEFGDFAIDKFDHRKNNHNYYMLRCKTCGHVEVAAEENLKDDRKCIIHNPDAKLTGRFGISKAATQEERNKIIEDRYKGKTYGVLYIESLAENKGNGNIYFYCTCKDCGKEHIPVKIDSIKKWGRTNKCDCSNYNEDLTGKQFGDLKVLALSRKANGRKYYNCRCIKCGDIIEDIRSDDIKTYGKSSKCSCIKIKGKNKPDIEKIKDDLSGRIFGDLTVVEFSHIDSMSHKSMYKCKCSKGHISIVSRSNLLSGNTTRCEKCGYEARANSNTIDLTGKWFGEVEVLEKDKDNLDSKLYGEVYWKCKCHYINDDGTECGCIFSRPGVYLRKGRIKSCGKHIELHHSYKHGFLSNHGNPDMKFYSEWSSIKYRCHNVDIYIKRGMDESWNEFENFKNDMYESYIETIELYGIEELSNISIDRIDNDGPYSKDNAEWTNRLVQANNKDSNYEYFGSMYTLSNLYRNFADPGLSFLEFRNNMFKGYNISKSLRNEDSRIATESPVIFRAPTGDIIADPITGRLY